MSMVSGPTVNDAISDASNRIAHLVANEPDDRKLVNTLYLQILNRPATQTEIDESLTYMDQVAADLGISVNAVFIAKSRVLKRLREVGEGILE